MARLRFLDHSLRTRLLAALMLVVAAGAGWIGWRRFHAAGASFDSGAVQDFLAVRFAALSQGVYHVRLGRIHVDLEHQGVRIDSVMISTDTLLNQRLTHPLPLLQVVLREALAIGVSRDSDGSGISIDEIRFGRIDALLTFAAPDTTVDERPVVSRDSSAPFVSWTVQLPAGAPQVRVGRVLLQGMSAELRPAPGTGGRVQRVERLNLVVDSVRLDRRVEGINAPVGVHDIRVQVADYRGGWDSISTASVGGIQGSFRDSTLRGRAIALTPTRSIGQVLHRGRTRRERFTLHVDSVEARGVDWGAAVRDGAIPARAVILHGADLEIYTDRRLPGRPSPRPRSPILQETLRRFGRPVAVDTIAFREASLLYRVRPEAGEGIGILDFRHINGTLTGMVWRPGRRSGAEAMLAVRAMLWGETPIALRVSGRPEGWLPQADLRLTVGAMPMIAANTLATPVGRMDIKGGMLDSLTVVVALKGDRCTGEARPYYRDLSVRLISRGGFFSRLAGGARTVFANSFVVRDDNPGKDSMMMVGGIDRTRDPWQGYWPFVWLCTRDGLGKVASGRGTELRP
jgi:hypothetical protein